MSATRLFVREAITRVSNRLVARAYRLVGFGAAPAGNELEPGLEMLPTRLPQEAPMWAELAAELRLRRISAGAR